MNRQFTISGFVTDELEFTRSPPTTPKKRAKTLPVILHLQLSSPGVFVATCTMRTASFVVCAILACAFLACTIVPRLLLILMRCLSIYFAMFCFCGIIFMLPSRLRSPRAVSVSATAIRAPELDEFQGGWNGSATNCTGTGSNDTRVVFVSFITDPVRPGFTAVFSFPLVSADSCAFPFSVSHRLCLIISCGCHLIPD